MSATPRALGREAGGSFTFIALTMATLVLISAGLLTDASKNTLHRAAQSARISALRDACFAGATWAERSVAQGDAAPAGTLSLARAEVEVSTVRRGAGGLVVLCKARNGIAETLNLEITIGPKGVADFRRVK